LFLMAPSVVARWPSSGTGSVLTVVLLVLGPNPRPGDLVASAYEIVPCAVGGEEDRDVFPSLDGEIFFFSVSIGLLASLFVDILPSIFQVNLL
jgi:hypothetical protein